VIELWIELYIVVSLVFVVIGIGFTVYHFKSGDEDAIPLMLSFFIGGAYLLFIAYWRW